MTDEQTPATSTDEVAAVGAIVTDGAYTLFVADFSDTDTAWTAYEALLAAEDGATVEIEGVLVVKRDAEGKLEIQKATDHSTKTGLKWGVVGGVVLGVIFPPSIFASAATLAPRAPRPARSGSCTIASNSARSWKARSNPATPASSPWSRIRALSRSATPWRPRITSSSRP